VTGKDIRVALLEPESVLLLNVGELVRPDIPSLRPMETLDLVLDKFARNDVESMPISNSNDPSRIEGLVTRHAVMRRYYEELDQQTA
ncbi:MAG: CBS domain-containing protein, partial [Phycisphaerae bacterium]